MHASKRLFAGLSLKVPPAVPPATPNQQLLTQWLRPIVLIECTILGVLERWHEQYRRETKSAGKHAYVLLDPHLSRDEILTLVCYSLTLVANKEYRRRITWLVTDDEAEHLYSALHGTQTTLKRSGMDHTVLPATNTMPALPRKRSPVGATTD